MTLCYSFAEATVVPATLEAHRAVYQIALGDTSFFVGREMPVATVRPELAAWRERLYVFMVRIAKSASDYVRNPPKRVVELGTQVEVQGTTQIGDRAIPAMVDKNLETIEFCVLPCFKGLACVCKSPLNPPIAVTV